MCVEMGLYKDISWESWSNIVINIWAHFYKILLVFEVPYRLESKRWLEKTKTKYQKLVKDASNLVSFNGSHIDGIVCVRQIYLDIRIMLRFIKLLYFDSLEMSS